MDRQRPAIYGSPRADATDDRIVTWGSARIDFGPKRNTRAQRMFWALAGLGAGKLPVYVLIEKIEGQYYEDLAPDERTRATNRLRQDTKDLRRQFEKAGIGDALEIVNTAHNIHTTYEIRVR